jgi:hypothetical protein
MFVRPVAAISIRSMVFAGGAFQGLAVISSRTYTIHGDVTDTRAKAHAESNLMYVHVSRYMLLTVTNPFTPCSQKAVSMSSHCDHC